MKSWGGKLEIVEEKILKERLSMKNLLTQREFQEENWRLMTEA